MLNSLTIDRVAQHEGFRAKPYVCPAGEWSVGEGLNLETASNGELAFIAHSASSKHFSFNEDTQKIEVKIELKKTTARALLTNRLKDIDKRLNREFEFYKLIDETRQGVLIEMAYQLGWSGLMDFKKMIKALQEQDYEKASIEMLDSKWAKRDTPKRAEKLAEIMRSGK